MFDKQIDKRFDSIYERYEFKDTFKDDISFFESTIDKIKDYDKIGILDRILDNNLDLLSDDFRDVFENIFPNNPDLSFLTIQSLFTKFLVDTENLDKNVSEVDLDFIKNALGLSTVENRTNTAILYLYAAIMQNMMTLPNIRFLIKTSILSKIKFVGFTLTGKMMDINNAMDDELKNFDINMTYDSYMDMITRCIIKILRVFEKSSSDVITMCNGVRNIYKNVIN